MADEFDEIRKHRWIGTWGVLAVLLWMAGPIVLMSGAGDRWMFRLMGAAVICFANSVTGVAFHFLRALWR